MKKVIKANKGRVVADNQGEGEDVDFKVTIKVTMPGITFDRYSDDSDDITKQLIQLIYEGEFEYVDSEYY